MPCQDFGPLEGHQLQEAKNNASFREEAINSRQRLHDATMVACEACKLLEQHQILDTLSTKAKSWFDIHQKLDTQRVREQIMAKLSDEEREEFNRVLALADF